MKLYLFTIVTCLLTSALSYAENSKYHLFVLSGQSNMQGMNPNTGLMPEAKNIFKDSDVKYIKISKGGRPIRLWVNEWNSIAERHELKVRIETTEFYQPILTEYSKMIKDFGKPKSITFCWMQGERDAKENLSLAYEDALNQLIKNLRRDLKRPDMSFVIGRISDHIKESHKSWTGVRKAQVKVAKDDPLGAWVDCDDLNNMTDKNGKLRDDLHYTKKGYETLGRRFARQAKLIIDGKPPSISGRPN